jgi:uncharacterized PurR-regulated membrane protein YhhQ (DUF165 family)
MVATLLAAGAGPGAAIVFLVTGTATNLPELFTLYKTIGKRIVLIYTGTLVLSSILCGFLINLWLLPGFSIHFNPLAHLDQITFSQCFSLNPELLLNTLSALAIALLAAFGLYTRLKPMWKKSTASCCPSEN